MSSYLQFSIAQQALWHAEAQNPAATLSELPVLLRRRLSPLGKMLAQVLHQVLPANSDIPWILASRHGEVKRSTLLLQQLLAGESPSPTEFALSVHNAACGILSIGRQATVPITAIAAGVQTQAAGFIEACGWLSQGYPQVLLLIADDELPSQYSPDAKPHSAYACGLLLTPGKQWQLQSSNQDSPDAADLLVGCLQNHGKLDLAGGWTLQHVG